MLTDARAQFRDAIRAAGLTPPDTIESDGELHRFASNGNRSDDAGWYVLHDDGILAGSFGCWRTGISHTWRADIGRRLSPLEASALAERAEQQRRKRDADDAKRHAEARQRAATIWKEAEPAFAAHPYLVAKGVQPHGIRQCGDDLVIPMRDTAGELHSLQTIPPQGKDKRFLSRGRVTGCYFSIGKPGDRICVAEGFATGASIHEATACAVAVAFDAGKLRAVAEAIKTKLPDVRIVICADDDYRTEGNPGRVKANEAALAVGGLVAVPDFGAERPVGATDFNDLARHRGPDAVKRAIANASPPAVAVGQPDEPNVIAGNPDGWPMPLPLPDGLPPVAAFDFALLPATLEPWARDVCERMQCPPDFVGVTIMAALGSVIGCKVGIRPQGHTDWTVVANQWALIVGRPGVLKSPAMEAALSPLKRLAAKAAESYQADITAYEIAARVAKIQGEANEKSARGKLANNPGANVAELLAVNAPERPTMRRYIANDTNAASLGELLRHNPNGTLVHRDELVSLLMTLDREDSSEARGFYLTGWNGDSSYTIDRIGRGMNLYIPALCISLLGSTQPGRIASYVRAAVKGGSGDDGLIQRFGLTVFPDAAPEWKDVDQLPDSRARSVANEVFDYLDTLDPANVGAQQDDFGGMPYLRLDDEARGLFLEWRTELETRLRSGELHLALESHLAKYRKLVPGLALIIHLAERKTGAVGKRSMLQALAWAQYLETHAKRLYASGLNQEVTAAKAVIAKLRGGHLAKTFSSRDVWRPGWANLSDPEQVSAGLRTLVDLDWLGVSKVETQGRTATTYTANPRAF